MLFPFTYSCWLSVRTDCTALVCHSILSLIFHFLFSKRIFTPRCLFDRLAQHYIGKTIWDWINFKEWCCRENHLTGTVFSLYISYRIPGVGNDFFSFYFFALSVDQVLLLFVCAYIKKEYVQHHSKQDKKQKQKNFNSRDAVRCNQVSIFEHRTHFFILHAFYLFFLIFIFYFILRDVFSPKRWIETLKKLKWNAGHKMNNRNWYEL